MCAAVHSSPHPHDTLLTLFARAVALVRSAEYINRYAARHWREFALQDYFDPRGVFISLMFSTPLLIGACRSARARAPSLEARGQRTRGSTLARALSSPTAPLTPSRRRPQPRSSCLSTRCARRARSWSRSSGGSFVKSSGGKRQQARRSERLSVMILQLCNPPGLQRPEALPAPTKAVEFCALF